MEEISEIISNATSSISKIETISSTANSLSCNNSPIHRNENVDINDKATSTHKTSIYIGQQQQVAEQQNQPERQQLQQNRRERRPDRAVYIPRARRSQTTPPNTAIPIYPLQPPLPQRYMPVLSVQQATITTANDTSKSLSQLATTFDDTTASVNQIQPSKVDEISKTKSGGINIVTCKSHISTATTINKTDKLNKENKESREQRLLRKISSNSLQQHNIQNDISKINVKLNEKSFNTIRNKNDDRNGDETITQTHSLSLSNDVKCFSELNDNIEHLSIGSTHDNSKGCKFKPNVINSQNSSVESKKNREFDTFFVDNFICNSSEKLFANEPVYKQSIKEIAETSANKISVVSDSLVIQNLNNTKNRMSKSADNTKSDIMVNSEVFNNIREPNLRIEHIGSQQSPRKCNIEEEELQRASKEINRSNRRIMKQTFVSDVLHIPDRVNKEENKKGKVNKKLATASTRPTTQSFDIYIEEEDDWENMYNDSGDCLDPKIMQELAASVGKCKIELPKIDCSVYLTKQSILNEEEFPHVLEVSNFPVEFKNQDLLMAFARYKESGFDIKWVDDTHALAVFSSSRIAAELLTTAHPFLVLKPLAEATIESRLKAKKCATSLQPYRVRPETCAALARRLVTGALGVRLKTAAAERENEKRVLREAKERKLSAAKKRHAVWES